ncbi:hypothetical protein [Rubinisphaera italica]|uniref:Uncharacterized protein n=1 Tax=Rubinisphaera italica TaxID=2527969 RepID=A0A5C5X8H8_9PLAN|nr:hypothetical protein [Rubinisphaera italica]TWT59316.1 hypothetical protein Pan54_00160 [Rubinisphaera italica]
MRPQTRILILIISGLLSGFSGCAIVQVGVSNPAPNLSRIAIAPFVNLSPERSVDGRRFAEAYFTELQKTPGFQVIPIGVVETAMAEHQINLDSPEDMLKLVEILDADSICFGAITEYTPYYPPRLGLQISWYTPGIPEFQPGIAVDPQMRKKIELECREAEAESSSWSRRLKKAWKEKSCSTAQLNPFRNKTEIRAQNADGEIDPLQAEWDRALQKALQLIYEQNPPLSLPVHIGPGFESPSQVAALRPQAMPPDEMEKYLAPEMHQEIEVYEDPFAYGSSQPYMSYTRVFDGADADFTASLRNYLELSGDQRSGGWTGHLHRSEDFIRFCMHRMILEMLQLHGGEARKRFVFTSRKYK